MPVSWLWMNGLAGKWLGNMGLTYIGTIGALVEAKHRGIIDRVFPVLEELRDRAGFRVSEALFNYVLNLANEKQ